MKVKAQSLFYACQKLMERANIKPCEILLRSI